MILTEHNMAADESLSNHAVVAFCCSECPLAERRACFGVATGFGGAITARCEHLAVEESTMNCTKEGSAE